MRLGILGQVRFCRRIIKRCFYWQCRRRAGIFISGMKTAGVLCDGGSGDGTDTGDGGGKGIELMQQKARKATIRLWSFG